MTKLLECLSREFLNKSGILKGSKRRIFKNRDVPDIRPDNPAFFDIRYPAGYKIALPDIR
jgi:hypothetical protein